MYKTESKHIRLPGSLRISIRAALVAFVILPLAAVIGGQREFYDLASYVIEVVQGGPARAERRSRADHDECDDREPRRPVEDVGLDAGVLCPSRPLWRVVAGVAPHRGSSSRFEKRTPTALPPARVAPIAKAATTGRSPASFIAQLYARPTISDRADSSAP
jgi:hypothetical protein